jgi:hypothetical protein
VLVGHEPADDAPEMNVPLSKREHRLDAPEADAAWHDPVVDVPHQPLSTKRKDRQRTNLLESVQLPVVGGIRNACVASDRVIGRI